MPRFDVHYRFVTKITVSVDVPEDALDDSFTLRRKAAIMADGVINGVSTETLGFAMTDPNLSEVTKYVERSEQ